MIIVNKNSSWKPEQEKLRNTECKMKTCDFGDQELSFSKLEIK